MGRLLKKRQRRVRKQVHAGRHPAPVGGHPGSGDSHPGAALKGKLQAGAGVLTKQVLQHFAGVDLGAISEAGGAGVMKGLHGFGGGRRRMKVTNVKALRRALRRVDGFSKLARKVMHFTGHKTAGRPKFRFRRRKRAA